MIMAMTVADWDWLDYWMADENFSVADVGVGGSVWAWIFDVWLYWLSLGGPLVP